MAGLNKIKIPIKANEVTIQAIEPYLSFIYNKFNINRSIIRADYNLYCLQHDILNKVRLHDEEINNKILSPHIRAMVDWKAGYILGNAIKYAQSKSTQTDDITELNKYIRNSNKRSVDTEVIKWVLSTGIGYYFIEPKSEDFDISYQAPFDVYSKDADTCGKVYSAYNGNKALFDFLYTTYQKIDEKGKETTVNVFSVYLPDAMYEYETEDGSKFTLTDTQSRGLYKYLPLVEKKYNANGIGISTIARYLQNAVDKIASSSVDNVEDVVNEVWLFFNTSLGDTADDKSENFKALKKLGAGEFMGNDPNHPADVRTISTKLNLNDVMEVRAILLKEMYDTNGVPIASSNVSSGNITKGGGEVANGYENAYNLALDNINTFISADNDLLERIIFICRNTPSSKINDLQPSEIDIKYCLNMTDNMLTKSQSYVNFITNGMPPAMALEKAKISNDPEAEGQMVEDYLAKKRKVEAEIESKSQTTETIIGISGEQPL